MLHLFPNFHLVVVGALPCSPVSTNFTTLVTDQPRCFAALVYVYSIGMTINNITYFFFWQFVTHKTLLTGIGWHAVPSIIFLQSNILRVNSFSNDWYIITFKYFCFSLSTIFTTALSLSTLKFLDLIINIFNFKEGQNSLYFKHIIIY